MATDRKQIYVTQLMVQNLFEMRVKLLSLIESCLNIVTVQLRALHWITEIVTTCTTCKRGTL